MRLIDADKLIALFDDYAASVKRDANLDAKTQMATVVTLAWMTWQAEQMARESKIEEEHEKEIGRVVNKLLEEKHALIRCKDCTQYDELCGCCKEREYVSVSEDEYCSRAERKGEERAES